MEKNLKEYLHAHTHTYLNHFAVYLKLIHQLYFNKKLFWKRKKKELRLFMH